MAVSELEKFNILAANLSARDREVRSQLLDTNQALGIGRYVMLLGRPVGVFVRGAVYAMEQFMPNDVIFDFVDGQQVVPDARTSYMIYADRVTVNQDLDGWDPEANLSVVSLARAVEGISLVRGDRDEFTPANLVSDEELAFVGRFARDPANTHASFRFLGEPGQPIAGVELGYIGPGNL